MQRSAAHLKRTRPSGSRGPAGSSGGLKAAFVTKTVRPGRLNGGVVTVSLPRTASFRGLRPRLFELHVQRALERIATLPDAQVAAELAQVERELSSPAAPARGADAVQRVDAALARAFARGNETQAAWATRSDLLTGEAFGAVVGLSRATVDNRRRAGQLLALELGAKRGVRYPAWQCELLADAACRASFERVLAALAGVAPTSAVRFFTQAAPALGGRTPLDALQAGEAASVLRAAKTWARGEQGGG